jgi:hypothetical protein
VIKRHHNHEQAAQKVDRIQPGSAGCLFFCGLVFLKNLRPGFFLRIACSGSRVDRRNVFSPKVMTCSFCERWLAEL